MLAAHTHRAPEALGHVEHSEHSTGLPGTPGDQPAADGLPGTRRGSASGSEQEQGAAEQGVTCIHVGGLENEVNGLEDEDKLSRRRRSRMQHAGASSETLPKPEYSSFLLP